MMAPKRQPIRSKKLRDSARDEECTLRLPGVCNGNPQTVVLAHLRCFGGGGMGTKPDDTAAIYCCSDCHDVLDGRRHMEHWPDGYIKQEAGRALCETLRRMIDKGLIDVKGAA